MMSREQLSERLDRCEHNLKELRDQENQRRQIAGPQCEFDHDQQAVRWLGKPLTGPMVNKKLMP